MEIAGVRYIHHALAYPRREEWSKEPSKQIWVSAAQAEADHRKEEV
jgi:hypothetical protein